MGILAVIVAGAIYWLDPLIDSMIWHILVRYGLGFVGCCFIGVAICAALVGIMPPSLQKRFVRTGIPTNAISQEPKPPAKDTQGGNIKIAEQRFNFRVPVDRKYTLAFSSPDDEEFNNAVQIINDMGKDGDRTGVDEMERFIRINAHDESELSKTDIATLMGQKREQENDVTIKFFGEDIEGEEWKDISSNEAMTRLREAMRDNPFRHTDELRYCYGVMKMSYSKFVDLIKRDMGPKAARAFAILFQHWIVSDNYLSGIRDRRER
jgi:hypothetical protein